MSQITRWGQVIGHNCRFLQGPGTDKKTVAIVREVRTAVKPRIAPNNSHGQHRNAEGKDSSIENKPRHFAAS